MHYIWLKSGTKISIISSRMAPISVRFPFFLSFFFGKVDQTTQREPFLNHVGDLNIKFETFKKGKMSTFNTFLFFYFFFFSFFLQNDVICLPLDISILAYVLIWIRLLDKWETWKYLIKTVTTLNLTVWDHWVLIWNQFSNVYLGSVSMKLFVRASLSTDGLDDPDQITFTSLVQFKDCCSLCMYLKKSSCIEELGLWVQPGGQTRYQCDWWASFINSSELFWVLVWLVGIIHQLFWAFLGKMDPVAQPACWISQFALTFYWSSFKNRMGTMYHYWEVHRD